MFTSKSAQERIGADAGFLFHTHCSAGRCSSSDPKDKVFALLPLISLSTSISVPHSDPSKLVNYSNSASKVLAGVATFLIMRVGLNVLKAI